MFTILFIYFAVSDEEGSDEVYFSEEEEYTEEREEKEQGPPISPSYHTVKNNKHKSNSNKPK